MSDVRVSVPGEDDRWMQPLKLAALGQLTAEWLEGSSVPRSPWQDGPPDPETLPLVPYLADMNRLGYVTEFSQPGVANGQRAAVTGFCEESQAECLASLSLESDLVVLSEYPGVESTYEIPITQEDERTFTVLPGRPHPDGMPGLHSSTLSLLSEQCYYVSIFDPCWGRDDLLWQSAVAALKRDPRDCAGSLIDPSNFT